MKKMNWIIIISVILIIATNGLFAQQKNVTVTYVGNAGFLINSDGTKILIDALFKGFQGGYNLSQNVVDKLTHAEAPFDDVI